MGHGLSWHNLRGIFSDDAEPVERSNRFDRWLTGVAEAGDPRAAHPDADPLGPLMAAAGAGKDDRGRRI